MKHIRMLLLIANIFLISFAITGCQKSEPDNTATNTAAKEQVLGAWTAKIQQRANVKSRIIWATICAPGTKLLVNEDGTLACETPIIWPPSDINDSQIKWNAIVVVACQSPDNTLKVPTTNDNGQLSCPSS
ncbi:MAG: hypothetical protein WBR29_02920 [Gammaproteobacteria bacterium]